MSDNKDQNHGYDLFKENSDFENNFINLIHSLQSKMEKSGTEISKEDIDFYFKEMELSEQQQNLIYDYLIKISGEQNKEDCFVQQSGMEIVSANSYETGHKTKLPDSDFFRLYLEDLQNIVPCSKEEENLLYEKLIKGDEFTVQKLSEQWLCKVLQIAQDQNVAADPKEFADMVQEGNISVFLYLQQMLGSGKRVDFEKELSEAAKNAMERYVQKTASDEEMDQSLLAKAALVYEAQKFLAEQFQRLPSNMELSQYTKLSEAELEDILTILEKEK